MHSRKCCNSFEKSKKIFGQQASWCAHSNGLLGRLQSESCVSSILNAVESLHSCVYRYTILRTILCKYSDALLLATPCVPGDPRWACFVPQGGGQRPRLETRNSVFYKLSVRRVWRVSPIRVTGKTYHNRAGSLAFRGVHFVRVQKTFQNVFPVKSCSQKNYYDLSLVAQIRKKKDRLEPAQQKSLILWTMVGSL